MRRTELRKSLFKIPLLKQYGKLVLFIHHKFKNYLIKKSRFINEKPSKKYLNDCENYNCFLYLPWIKTLTNKLINNINISDHYRLVPLGIFADTHALASRKKISFYVRTNPEELEQLLLGWLEPVATNIAGVIFTFDYNFLQRIILKVCRRLHIQTILIPHESVFFNRDKYYYHAISGVNSPLCDYVLCWGQLQKDIFVSRDYPGERISVVGAPKFDHYYNFQPKFTREQFCRKAKLNSHSKIVVYAAQSLDVQVNQPLALKAQQKIIDELISYCCKRQYGFILRYPPTQLPIVNERIITRMKRERFFIDNSIKGYCFEPEETIYHADVIISINSTMLFEALLMGKQTLSVRYFNFEEGWEKAGVPCINTRSELIQILDEWLQATEPTLGKITTWAKEAYSSGEFDGQASIRIRNFLESKIKNPVLKLDNAIERVLKDDLPGADMVYVPSFTKSYSYLPALIRTKRILTNKDTNLLPWADMTIQLSDFDDNRRAKKQRHLYKLSKLYVSKGLIRPKKPYLSIIMDDVGHYYEANKITRLQQLLNSNQELTSVQKEYAAYCMQRIVNNRISFSEYTKDLMELPGRIGCPKLLLIDECYDDPVVAGGRGGKEQFKQMLDDVLNKYPEYDLLIKPSSDFIQNKQKSHLSQWAIASYLNKYPNIFLLDYTINVYDLFNLVEEIFIVTSSIGFEALMAGKKVTCYGVPFFANLGLTSDKIQLNTRTRKRALSDIFHFLFVILSRYYTPGLARKCQLDEYLDYLITDRLNLTYDNSNFKKAS